MGKQEKVHRVLNEPDSLAGWVYRFCLVIAVAIVCVTFVWQTYATSERRLEILCAIDMGITILFFIDYLVRWWSERFSIRYLFTPLALVDFIAILPLFLSAHWQFVRVLRLFRILRLLRVLQRRQPGGWAVSEFHLRLVTIFFTLFCIIFISAGLIYDIEAKHNPQIHTFFDSLYFTVVSMTTVGFGDITPLSTAGRVATLLMIGSGVILIPWQLSELLRYIVRSGLKAQRSCQSCHTEWHETNALYCRNCGQKFDSSSGAGTKM